MKNKLACLFVFLFVVSCSNDSTPLTYEDLAGTYTLTGFEVTYSDGTVISSSDGYSYSGSMVITSDGGISQDITIEGYSISVDASYSIASGSTVTITTDGVACSYNVTFDLHDNALITTFNPTQCGITVKEVDYWTRISSSALQKEEEKNNHTYEFPIGSIIGGTLQAN